MRAVRRGRCTAIASVILLVMLTAGCALNPYHVGESLGNQLGGAVTDQPAPEWQLVSGDRTAGVSGVAVISRNGASAELLVVRDNKQPDENHVAKVVLAQGQAPKTEALSWDGEPPVDLEALHGIPGRSGEYVALASDGQGFRLRLEDGKVVVVQSFALPEGQEGDNYEGLGLVSFGGKLVAVWSDRGEDARAAHVYAAELDLENLTFGTVAAAEFKAPKPTANVRHVSDMEVTGAGGIVVSSVADPGDDGPFESVLYNAGQVSFDSSGSVLLEMSARPLEMAVHHGRKIEAVTSLPETGDRFVLGSDDENAGGSVRLG